jgi:hypothetical protein
MAWLKRRTTRIEAEEKATRLLSLPSRSPPMMCPVHDLQLAFGTAAWWQRNFWVNKKE